MRDRAESVSMNPTLKLLRVIGSPFVPERELPKNVDDALELYSYATKNKIGLIYLESLRDRGKLEDFGLQSKYQEEQKKHDVQLITAIRISELFNSSGVNYAIFKSIMPFPATPNDVDIIHFGSGEEYEKAVEILLKSNYIEVKGQADAEQRMFHDARECKEHIKKDVYDVDIYQEVSASYVRYLDKRKLEKYVTEMNMSNNKLNVLRPEAELVASIIHSIIPEQLFTGLVYYATLYYLINESFNINEFIHITKENNVTFPVKAHCSLVAEMHQAAHGFIPEKIEGILSELGDETSERKNLLKNNFKMPHKYSLSAVIRTFLVKMKEREFRRSVVKQMVYMLNPKLFKWVVYNIIWRRKRETY